MNRYRYIGNNVAFLNCTALGRAVQGHFKIQVDQLDHAMSHGWHVVNRLEWVEIQS